MDLLAVLTVLLAAWTADSTVYFKEEFSDGDAYTARWVPSTYKGSEMGAFKLSSGQFYGDVEKDKGIQTSQDARFYGISAKFGPFSNEGKSLVVQFQVKHEQNIDCGGGYVKIYGSELDQASMHGDTPYHVMFGPDICGSTKRVHVIFTHKGANHLVKREISCKNDELTHLYTLVVNPDNTYVVKIDGDEVQKGSLEEDWDMLPAKEILDPDQKKPDDWVDAETMPDPEDTKPEDWDKPQHVPDASAAKPEDWDDEMDGEWEAAMVDNPEYKGEWKAKEIPNANYKGPWVHPKIANPEYVHDPLLYRYEDVAAIGFDLWQVKSGTIFDNVFVGDDPAEAEAFAKETFDVTKVAEKKMFDAAKAKADEEAAAEAAAAPPEDPPGEDEDEEGEDDEVEADEADDAGEADGADEVEADDGDEAEMTESHDEL